MRHRATGELWRCYNRLPLAVQRAADLAYGLLKADPRHLSLHFKKVGRYWSVRIGLHYRSLSIEEGSDLLRFWIGHHGEYDRLHDRP